MKTKQIGVTLTNSTLENLEELIKGHKRKTGVELTKSQMISMLINLKKAGEVE